MNDYPTRHVLVVFLASPGDVQLERDAAKKLIPTLNKVTRKLGWEIDLGVWEDVSPGSGRPQALINRDVRECSLFVGLLHARWGMNSGKYSSGFEEEYELARELRTANGRPEICLFFKKVADAQKRDPGPQLKKVLKFRKRVEKQRECLFSEVETTDDWTLKLHLLLLNHVMDLRACARSHYAA